MMTTKIVPLNYTSFDGGTKWRFQVSGSTSRFKHKCHFLGHQSLPILISSSLELNIATLAKIETAIHSAVDSGSPPPPPPDAPPTSWKLWTLGILISVVLPFWRNNWWPLQKFKDKIESIVKSADEVTEVVEKVAEEVEKLAEEAADVLPEGGKLKEVAILVENVAKETEKEAHLAEDVIDKVEKVEKAAESLIESVIDQANEKNTETKSSGTDKEAKD